MIYLTLFFRFFLIGLLAVGGGAATIPFLFDLSQKYAWFSTNQLSEMIAISESTPGPIGVNMATFAGFHAGGYAGAIVATLGLVTPSVIVIILLSKLVNQFHCDTQLNNILKFMQPSIVALILYATYQIGVLSLNNILPFAIFGIIITLIYRYPKSPIFYIVLSGILGIVFQL